MTDLDKVSDLRARLINLGLTQEEAEAIKGKSNLRLKIEELEDTGCVLDENVEVVEDKTEFVENQTPSQFDPKWSDYVLSLLEEDEKQDGNPTVDGLRRIAQQLLGPISKIESNIVQLPTPDNKERATVVVTIVLVSGVTAMGAADSYTGNTDTTYRNYPVAVAETRAEGRALKRLLCLRKVISAEEKTAKENLEDLTLDTVGKITQPQIQYLEIVCRDRLGINITKLLNKQLPNISSINDVPYTEALELFKLLSSYQSTGVPEELLGYNQDWKINLTDEHVASEQIGEKP